MGSNATTGYRSQAGTALRGESHANVDPFAASPVRALYTEDRAVDMVAQLRAMLARDHSPETIAALQSDLARGIEH